MKTLRANSRISILLAFIFTAFLISCGEGDKGSNENGENSADSTSESAGDKNFAVIVVDFGGEAGPAKVECVKFAKDAELTGMDLLEKSGLSYEEGSGLICTVDGIGCPSDDCFCMCKDEDDCKYWVYYHMVNGEWQFAMEGPASYDVENGAIDAWMWGDSTMRPTMEGLSEACN